jgi:hypothetical protein
MKFGYRKPSIKKRIAARKSLKRAIRSKTGVPKGYGWITNPKKAMYTIVCTTALRKRPATLLLLFMEMLMPGKWSN